MIHNNVLNRITADQNVMVGKPVIRGLRITVEQILKSLANGITVEELLEDYPILEKEDIQAVLLYAYEKVSSEQNRPVQLARSPIGTAYL